MATIDIKHVQVGGNPAGFLQGRETPEEPGPVRKGRITLVIGGDRSGKSTYAEDYALEAASDRGRYFLSTAEEDATDDGMSGRLLAHRASRESRFITREVPIELAAAVSQLPASCEICIIDSLSVWVGNALKHGVWEGRSDALLDALVNAACDVIIVTSETGIGWSSDDPDVRRFVEETGKLHQKVASMADNVIMMVAGIPLAIKGRVL